MVRKTFKLSVGVMLATMALTPRATLAQFPPPPPAVAGPPPLPAGGPPPGLGGLPRMVPGAGVRPGFAGPAPRLNAADAPRGNFGAVRAVRGTPALERGGRSVSLSYSRSGGDGYRYGGWRYGRRAAYAAGAYAAGAYAGYYGSSGYGYSDDCYYIYRRGRRVLVCN